MNAEAPTRWWWIRHAPVESGGRIYGQLDLACDCGDREAFAALARLLPKDALWVTSHLRRTRETAEALWHAGAVAGAHLVEPRFAEQNFGRWQGMTHQELAAAHSPGWHRFWLAPAEERPPDGESFRDLSERVQAAVRELTAAHPGRDLVAVAHGGTIRAALALALDLQPERALSFSIANCSLTRLEAFSDDPPAWGVSLVNFSPKSLL